MMNNRRRNGTRNPGRTWRRIEVWTTTVVAVRIFEKASLEWCRGNSKVWENPVRENTTHYTVGYTCKVVLSSYLALGCEVT
jgi:hypothetical protein